MASATNGEQALAFCEQRLPDLVFLDVAMLVSMAMRCAAGSRPIREPAMCHHIRDGPRPGVEDESRAWKRAPSTSSETLHPSIVLARVRTQIMLKHRRISCAAWHRRLTDRGRKKARLRGKADIEWRRCQRRRIPLSLIMIDIDHFKLYNDTYGHKAGDNCLQHVASALSAVLRRAGDMLSRYGGEEFVCLLPGTGLDGAVERADEIGQAVERLNIIHANPTTGPMVTVSRGVSATIPGHEIEIVDLVAGRGRHAYQAKRAGRNCTMSCPLGRVKPSNAG